MGAPLTIPPPGFEDLTVEEQIDYVQRLWNRITRSPQEVPVHASQMDVLEKRLDEFERDGKRGRTADEVREDLEARLRARRE